MGALDQVAGTRPHEVTLIAGDGIGPEIMAATELVLEATGVDLVFDRRTAGMHGLEAEGALLPSATVASVARTGVALKGPLTNDPHAAALRSNQGTDLAHGFSTPMIALRHHLDIHANLRWARAMRRNGDGRPPIDVWVVREVTEDVYNGREIAIEDGSVVVVKKTTARASERIARTVFEFAERHGRRRVTAIHKAEVMPLSDGLFAETVRGVAAGHPAVAFDEMAPDAAAMHLIRHPERFDVLLLQFVIGDVFCDLCAALAGGIGVMGGMNVGRDAAVFEAAHGSAPKHAGHGRANPTALVLSGALMLAHLGEAEASRRVVAAVSEVVARGEHVTYDLGGEASTMDMASAIAEQVRSPARTPTGEPA